MTGPTRLPNRPIRLAMVSGEYPQLAKALAEFGVASLLTRKDSRLPDPVGWHPDMQFCVIDERLVVAKATPSLAIVKDRSYLETERVPDSVYPQDVLCNVLSWGSWAIGNRRYADETVLRVAEQAGLRWISVRQGYTACSTALVDASSAITADQGVAAALRAVGIEVLLLEPGGIVLPGYKHGFIGGCCGKLAPNLMAFAGQLSSHPQGERVRAFLKARGIFPVELLDSELLDAGGIIPLA